MSGHVDGVGDDQRGNWLSTHTGRRYYIEDPIVDDINIMDISIGLGNCARFSGQCLFYSVAEHSVFVASLLPPHLQFAGLMHDASEAYLGDIVRPIRMMSKFKEIYDPLESASMKAIAERFNIKGLDDPLVKMADEFALCVEARVLKSVTSYDWEILKLEDYYRRNLEAQSNTHEWYKPAGLDPSSSDLRFRSFFSKITAEETKRRS